MVALTAEVYVLPTCAAAWAVVSSVQASTCDDPPWPDAEAGFVDAGAAEPEPAVGLSVIVVAVLTGPAASGFELLEHAVRLAIMAMLTGASHRRIRIEFSPFCFGGGAAVPPNPTRPA
jgi:hypothetical protein